MTADGILIVWSFARPAGRVRMGNRLTVEAMALLHRADRDQYPTRALAAWLEGRNETVQGDYGH